MKMRRIITAIYDRSPWISYGEGYQVHVRRPREFVVEVPEYPTRRAYRANLTAEIPHSGSPQFPWWRR